MRGRICRVMTGSLDLGHGLGRWSLLRRCKTPTNHDMDTEDAAALRQVVTRPRVPGHVGRSSDALSGDEAILHEAEYLSSSCVIKVKPAFETRTIMRNDAFPTSLLIIGCTA